MIRQKASVRSRGSSSSSASNPRKRIKNCCRKFVAFMCTQVGVGGLIVVYAVVGALSFQSIESNRPDDSLEIVAKLRKNCSFHLWTHMEALNLFNRTNWQNKTDNVLLDFQKEISSMIKLGYDGRTPTQTWTFVAALMYCLSVFTMIGYGHMVPRTTWGKGATVLYATFGIPLYILYFLNMGKVLAETFKFLYTMIHECTHEKSPINLTSSIENGDMMNDDDNDDDLNSDNILPPKKIIVPSTACLWVIIFYVIAGTIMFKYWEKWDYLDAVYFCVTSLCKIGFGDFVPGGSIQPVNNFNTTTATTEQPTLLQNNNNNNNITNIINIETTIAEKEQQFKLAITFIYMLIGMGLVAMCYNLMREEVRVKLKEMKEDFKLCMDDVRAKFAGCCGGGGGGGRDYDDDDLY